jgi:ABC-type branched-subunit amino acid transport system permease subunit
MVFTDINVATLVSWFITGVVMMFSGSYFMSKWKFRRYYMYLQDHKKSSSLFQIPTNAYGFIWILVAGSQIAAMVLWTMNYSACRLNTYYVAVVALALGEFLFISMWAPLFARMENPKGAAFTTFVAFACGTAALVLMAITTASNDTNCTFDGNSYRGPGIAACILWGGPLLWLILVFAITVTVSRHRHFHYHHWLHHHHFPYVTHKHTAQEEERFHPPSRGYEQHYGGVDSELGAPLKQRSANLKPQ